ncbi:hypothetical protein EVAR_23240_1 [Eumeta japonica]|uniref:Uncharacterized protein n=1 Tax=Eumeta variegata TaxID=151549 RepID=A0A4C1VF93_EUMVA|nr:hypothetical protein EVAR_23240_1 [Eumeta japonica]
MGIIAILITPRERSFGTMNDLIFAGFPGLFVKIPASRPPIGPRPNAHTTCAPQTDDHLYLYKGGRRGNYFVPSALNLQAAGAGRRARRRSRRPE